MDRAAEESFEEAGRLLGKVDTAAEAVAAVLGRGIVVADTRFPGEKLCLMTTCHGLA